MPSLKDLQVSVNVEENDLKVIAGIIVNWQNKVDAEIQKLHARIEVLEKQAKA